MSSIIELSDIDEYNEEDLVKMVSKCYLNYIILLGNIYQKLTNKNRARIIVIVKMN
jgi:hypothetical protein